MATNPKPKVAVKRVAKRSPKKSTKSKVSAKERGRKAVTKASKRGRRAVTKASKRGRRAVTKASKRGRKIVERARKGLRSVNRDTTTKRTAKLTLSLVNFQKTTFDSAINVIGKVQDQTGKIMRELLKNQGWVPGEGREVVDEWIKATTKARNDFKKSTDKSFDLVSKFVRRIERDQLSKRAGEAMAPAKKTKAKPKKKKAAKKATAKRALKSQATGE